MPALVRVVAHLVEYYTNVRYIRKHYSGNVYVNKDLRQRDF